jgi:hypothetical protein
VKLVELPCVDTTNYVNPLHVSHIMYSGDGESVVGSTVVMAHSANNESVSLYTDLTPPEVRALIDEAMRN